MNTTPLSLHGTVRHTPASRPSPLITALSGALVVVAAFASAVGVFFPGIFNDPAVTAGNARGTDLVILALALPLVAISMMLVVRGSARAHVLWLGALIYIAYNSIFFAYGAHFNSLMLVYAATLSLAVWSIVLFVRDADAEVLRAHATPSMPIRPLAVYLLASTALFVLVWLKDIVPAIVHNTRPGALAGTGLVTNPVQVTDFAFMFPLTIMAAIWLWQGRAWGYLLGGAFLVYSVIEAVSVATDQVFGHISDPTQSLAAVPVFAVLTLIGLVPMTVFFHNIERKRAHDVAPRRTTHRALSAGLHTRARHVWPWHPSSSGKV